MFLFWFMQKVVGSLLCVYCVFVKSTNSNDLVSLPICVITQWLVEIIAIG